jgi:polysaccharide pyruvyl transferase WcaK-like protein
MIATMIGWYGTETIGDRAIFAGILRVLSDVYNDELEIRIGSLYPPLTERTILEDNEFYKRISSKRISKFECFYSLSKSTLDRMIKGSDLLFIGGGPLMDMQVMYMLKYCFKRAHKLGIKTAIIGCGWGPLKEKEFVDVTTDIIKLSDVSIFRDSKSSDKAINVTMNKGNIVGYTDPAVFAASFYLNEKNKLKHSENIVSMNFRELFVSNEKLEGHFPISYCKNVIEAMLSHYPECIIKLVPMHTFAIGGDDRIISNKLAMELQQFPIDVQNVPLSLEETMTVYYSSVACVGMRFHSILLQIILCGNNYILDYTHPDNGKTINLLKQLDVLDDYLPRYVNWSSVTDLNISKDSTPRSSLSSKIEMYYNKYKKTLSDCLV